MASRCRNRIGGVVELRLTWTVPFLTQARYRRPSLTARLASLKVCRVDACSLSLTSILKPVSQSEISDPSRALLARLPSIHLFLISHEDNPTTSGRGRSPFAGMRKHVTMSPGDTTTPNAEAILIAIARENDSSSDSSDDDILLQVLSKIDGKRGPLLLKPRVQNYIQNVVSVLSNVDFKSHFR